MPKMKNSAKSQTPALPAEGAEIPSQQEESTSSDQESDTEVLLHRFKLQTHHNFIQTCSCFIWRGFAWT